MATYDEDDGVQRVWRLLRDYGQNETEQLLTDTEVKDLGLRGAEAIYSRARPRIIIGNLTGNGTNFLAMPTGWVEGFSVISSIESPPDAIPAEVLDSRDFYIGLDSAGAQRLVLLAAPANTAPVRVAFTVPRALAAAAGNTTVLDTDFVAFCDLAASICADAIAAKYARTSEPAFNAEVVNYRTRAMEWRDIAKRLWDRWMTGIGAGKDGALPATSGWVNWDLPRSYRDRRSRIAG